MTLKQLDKWADELAEQHHLSGQLTLAWLAEKNFPYRMTLAPKQVADLIAFAKV